jgi:tetratricopeptide (TPR) repeat protein
LQPDQAEAYFYHAKALAKQKKYNEALDYLDMGIDFAISDKSLLKSFYKQYISIYQALNKYSKVKIYQQKLSKL